MIEAEPALTPLITQDVPSLPTARTLESVDEYVTFET
jgi:hypothetical protein